MSHLSFVNNGRQDMTAQDQILNNFVDRLRDQVEGQKIITTAMGRAVASLESIKESDVHVLESARNTIETSLETISRDLFGDASVTAATFNPSQAAATLAGIMAGDWKSAMTRPTRDTRVSTENFHVMDAFDGGGLMKRSFGLEAFDERENKNAIVYSIAYNYQASRQDEFGETLWPTLTLTNENVGFGITVNLMTVFDAIERKTSGATVNWNKRNIIRAIKNPNILKKDQTKIVPVWRTASQANFSTVIPHANYMLEGESIPSAPLAFKKKIDLIGISQTDALLATGVSNQNDALDPAISLANVYLIVGDDVLKFPTLNLAYSNFVASPQHNYRESNLNFRTVGMMINKDTKQLDGSALGDLAAVVTNDWVVQLEMDVTGNCNIELAETFLSGNRVAVYKIFDADGDELDITTGAPKAVADLFASAVFDSYDIHAYRTNMNRRQLGQLIDVTKFTQLYNIPLRSPITSQHPINNDGSTDASDVQALIATTRIRMCNDSVTELFKVADTLQQVTDPRLQIDMTQAISAIGKYYVIPTWMADNVDMATAIDSIKSHERAADIQAVLINKIRDFAYRMYRDSEYKAAADALSGGISKVPVVIVATDPVIARYINVEGDLRTLSGGFDIRIVSTLDERMEGKIFITFGVFDDTRNVAPNPLNFGNMVWAPEMVLSANIQRSGISKETVVQPRYSYVWHLPILGLIQVSNIPAVLNSVAIDVKITP